MFLQLYNHWMINNKLERGEDVVRRYVQTEDFIQFCDRRQNFLIQFKESLHELEVATTWQKIVFWDAPQRPGGEIARILVYKY